MNHSMTWADFYLVCFAVGFCLSFFSFVFGGARTGRLHLPHFHGHVAGAHLPTTTMPAAHAPVAAHAPAGVKAAGRSRRAAERSFAVQLRHVDRVPGLVWRHRIPAYTLFRSVDRFWIAGFHHQRIGWGRDSVSVPEQSSDLGGREHGSGGLRDGRRAGTNL